MTLHRPKIAKHSHRATAGRLGWRGNTPPTIVGQPTMTDRSIKVGGAIAFALLCVVAIWHKLPDIETGVIASTAEALDAAGIEYESIDVAGRTAEIVLPQGSLVSEAEVNEAIAVGFVEKVFRTKVAYAASTSVRATASPTTLVASTTTVRRVEPVRSPELRIEVRDGAVLSLSGRVGSPTDASALARLIGPPRGWNLIEDSSTIALPREVLAIIEAATDGLSDGNISLSDDVLLITGTYAGAEAAARLKELQNQADGEFTATYEIVERFDAIDADIEKIAELARIEFDSGTTNINPESLVVLDELAIIMLAEPRLNITIAGHSDSVGDKATNLRLSTGRAEAVASYLIESGVDADSIATVGFGDSQPIADNSTAEGRAINRRIVLLATREGAAS